MHKNRSYINFSFPGHGSVTDFRKMANILLLITFPVSSPAARIDYAPAYCVDEGANSSGGEPQSEELQDVGRSPENGRSVVCENELSEKKTFLQKTDLIPDRFEQLAQPGSDQIKPVFLRTSDLETGEITHQLLVKPFDIRLASERLLAEIIDDENTAEIVVDNTLDLAMEFNLIWHSVDNELAYRIYQGLESLGFAESEYYSSNGLYGQRVFSSISDDVYFPEPSLKPTQSKKPKGLAGFIFYLPTLLSFKNFLFLIVGLFIANVLFRILRYIVIRL
ncbi:MAG: hypothetical protein ACU84J_09630 [Gammaproteobacteria bacterium]